MHIRGMVMAKVIEGSYEGKLKAKSSSLAAEIHLMLEDDARISVETLTILSEIFQKQPLIAADNNVLMVFSSLINTKDAELSRNPEVVPGREDYLSVMSDFNAVLSKHGLEEKEADENIFWYATRVLNFTQGVSGNKADPVIKQTIDIFSKQDGSKIDVLGSIDNIARNNVLRYSDNIRSYALNKLSGRSFEKRIHTASSILKDPASSKKICAVALETQIRDELRFLKSEKKTLTPEQEKEIFTPLIGMVSGKDKAKGNFAVSALSHLGMDDYVIQDETILEDMADAFIQHARSASKDGYVHTALESLTVLRPEMMQNRVKGYVINHVKDLTFSERDDYSATQVVNNVLEGKKQICMSPLLGRGKAKRIIEDFKRGKDIIAAAQKREEDARRNDTLNNLNKLSGREISSPNCLHI